MGEKFSTSIEPTLTESAASAKLISCSGANFNRCSWLSRRGDFERDAWLRRGCRAAPVNCGRARLRRPDGVAGGNDERTAVPSIAGGKAEGPGSPSPPVDGLANFRHKN